MKSHNGIINDSLDNLNGDQKGTFKDGFGTIILEPGDLLFRFCRSVGNKYSDCWTDKETIKEIFKKYSQRINQSPGKNKNAAINAQVYNTLGIAKSWSNLEYLLVVEIKKELIAYEGSIKEQSFFQTIDQNSELRKIKVAGLGGKQYLIPRVKYYNNNNDFDSIHHYMIDKEIKKFVESSWYKRIVIAGYSI